MTIDTPTATLKAYSTRASNLPLLGSLIWYSVPDAVRVQHDVLTKLLEDLGLGEYALPEVRDKNVFLRVASSHARKRVPTDDPAVYENYLVRNVLDRGDKAVKQIVVEQVNASGVKLNLTPAVQVEYDAGVIALTHLPSVLGQHDQAMAVAELIERDYSEQRNTVNAYGVRELIRRIVLRSGATTVRPSGGVYFLMAAKADVIEALVKLADSIALVDVHPVPLIDDTRQRDMLRKAVEAETLDKIDKSMGAIEKIESLTPQRYASLAAEMNELKAKTTEYVDLLDESLDAAQFRLRVYEAKIRQLYDKVD